MTSFPSGHIFDDEFADWGARSLRLELDNEFLLLVFAEHFVEEFRGAALLAIHANSEFVLLRSGFVVSSHEGAYLRLLFRLS